MLVNLSEILGPAEKKGGAVIAPDFISVRMLRHYLSVAEKYETPIIASYPPLFIDRFRHFDRWVNKLRHLCHAARVPVCLHLDHGKDVKTCQKAISGGFTSVMIDASTFDLEENICMTQEVVEAAGKAGVSVEAEIGHVGANRDSAEGKAAASALTDPEQAGYFAEQTGVDALAVSIGTLHGTYRGAPHIDFQRLSDIRSRVSIPLVLHGGSGTGEENIRRSVEGGIRKINVFTDIIKPYVKASLTGIGPFRIWPSPGTPRSVVDRILKHYFEISGSLRMRADNSGM